MEEWIPIPGYTRYQVCTTRPGFRTNWRGEWREKKMPRTNTMLAKGNERYSICWARALYCAQRGIDPSKTKGANVKVYCTLEGELKALTHAEMAQKIAETKAKRKAEEMNDGKAEKKYEEIIEFATIAIDFLKTGNGEKLSRYLYSKKENIARYLMYRERMDRKTCEEIASISIETTIRTIQERREIVSVPTKYMQKIALGIIREERRYRIVQRDSYLVERISLF